MNLDRNRVLMIFGVALLGAALLTWLLYSLTAGPRQQKLISVYAASRDLPAGTRLKKTDVKKVEVVDKDVPRGGVMEERILLDRVLLFPVNGNEAITVNKLASSTGVEGVAAIIEPGKRAVSVSINDTTGVAGLVGPRSHVDVLFTRPGSMAEAATTTVLQDVTVLSVGRVTEVSQTPVSGTQQAAPTVSATQNRAVTLLVTPEQAEKLELAKNQGKLSLTLRNPLDKSSAETSAPTTAINLYDPNALKRPGQNPFLRGAPQNSGANRNLWSSLTGMDGAAERPVKKEAEKKEPAAKRFVVDVYRGEKHVQEIFQ